jgi:LacI family transcriptional regulator
MSPLRITLKHVADLAGVSTSTASRALINDPRILPTTRETVLKAADKLNYRPNILARSLKSRKTTMLGIAINNLQNSTLREIVERFQKLAGAENLQVLLSVTNGNPDEEARFLDMAMELQLTGVIVAGSGQNADRLNLLMARGISTVSMIRLVEGAEAQSILPDYYQSSVLATQHLISKGHERISFIGGHKIFTSGRETLKGFYDTMFASNLEPDESCIYLGPFEPSFGSAAGKKFVETLGQSKSTALIVANHEASHELLPFLAQSKISIPNELSIICLEDAEWFTWWHPPISAINNRPREMAELAFEIIHPKNYGLKSANTGAKNFRISPILVERETVASLNGSDRRQ